MSDHEPYGLGHGSHDDDPILPITGGHDEGHGASHGASHGGGHRGGRGRRRSGCLPVLLVLAVLAAGGYFLVRSIDISNPFSSSAPEDFAGPGSGSVPFSVKSGDSIAVMARNLKELGVTASVDAYIAAAGADPASRGIREGTYRLKKQMRAADVIDVLVGAKTKGTSFTFTAGKTLDEVVALLAKDTGVARKQYEAALDKPGSIGLPDGAEGSAEGYLSPGSYTFFPGDDATTILSMMVARTDQTLEKVDLAGAAERLGYTEHELMTVASLVEAEGSLLDETGKAKIARVVYNRLEIDGNPSAGFLGIDATIDYIYGEKVARRTFAEIDAVADNPYNTYKQQGLPPGPIATPSAAALEAATNPVDGPWFYYVTTNLRTGQTKFAETPEQFAQLRAEFDQYCATQSDRC